MPKQLNNGRITQALQAAFGFKGRYIPMLDEVIVPVYAISDPVPSEPQASFARRMIATEAPAAFTSIKFTNPETSGVLAMITQVSAATFVDTPTPTEVVGLTAIISDSTELNNDDGLSAVARDTRVSSGSAKCNMTFTQTSLNVNTLSALATILLLTDQRVAQVVGGLGESVERIPPLVIRPGRGVQLVLSGSAGQDIPLLANFSWTEVPTGGPATPRGF